MFTVGAQVSHPGHGACKVSEICVLDLTGTMVEYYKLIPYHGASEIVYVPIASAKAIGIRYLISKDQAYILLNALADTTEKWFSDTITKQKRYRSLFTNNTVDSLNETLSAMSAIVKQKREKELGSVDKAMLETIQKKVMSELAVALGISLKDAIKQAEELILLPAG